MPRTVWKFQLRIDDEFNIPMPKGAEILHVATQRDGPCIWAYVDPGAPAENRRFRLVGTGHPMPDKPLSYVGSFMLHGGSLVFHLFEEGEAHA